MRIWNKNSRLRGLLNQEYMKMTGSKDDSASKKELELTNEQVSNFLSNHPNFFQENPDTLQSIMIPSRWSGDGVADMQRFMLEQLRGEIDNIRDCAQDVIETSRTNMSVQTRTHTAVLASQLLCCRLSCFWQRSQAACCCTVG